MNLKPLADIPPYYSPELVAKAVVQCATHITRDFYVGDVGRVLAGLQRLSPELVDALLLAIGFGLQLSDEPKLPQAPNNVYDTVPQESRMDGDFTKWVVPSLSDWLAKTFADGVRS